MTKPSREPQDPHRIVWRNADRRPGDVVLICACGTKFRNGAESAEFFWQIHRESS